MKVLIATDGTLDPIAAAEASARLAGQDGEVTVFTVVEIPRRLLTDLREVYGESSTPPPIFDLSIETAGHPTPRPHLSSDWPGDDTFIRRYVDDQKTSRTEPLVAALADRGITTHPIAVESEDPVAEILKMSADGNYDVICVGSRGQGRFDGFLGSTSTKIIRRAPRAVLTIRS
ncbi:MAG: universal stress protein [Acidimicrobiia bacterium]|nr:universal stress protein [Acidimicrobiia bacterium]